jgi:hypothetical protein
LQRCDEGIVQLERADLHLDVAELAQRLAVADAGQRHRAGILVGDAARSPDLEIDDESPRRSREPSLRFG